MYLASLLRVIQKFITEYINLWPVVKPSKAGEYYAFCNVCKMDFAISQRGRDECLQHVLTKKPC